MPPDTKRPSSGSPDAFEVAYYTKELGRPLQRQLLRQRLADLNETRGPEAGHGEEGGASTEAGQTPREDRAG
jgi:hypothetical protein